MSVCLAVCVWLHLRLYLRVYANGRLIVSTSVTTFSKEAIPLCGRNKKGVKKQGGDVTLMPPRAVTCSTQHRQTRQDRGPESHRGPSVVAQTKERGQTCCPVRNHSFFYCTTFCCFPDLSVFFQPHILPRLIRCPPSCRGPRVFFPPAACVRSLTSLEDRSVHGGSRFHPATLVTRSQKTAAVLVLRCVRLGKRTAR